MYSTDAQVCNLRREFSCKKHVIVLSTSHFEVGTLNSKCKSLAAAHEGGRHDEKASNSLLTYICMRMRPELIYTGSVRNYLVDIQTLSCTDSGKCASNVKGMYVY